MLLTSDCLPSVHQALSIKHDRDCGSDGKSDGGSEMKEEGNASAIFIADGTNDNLALALSDGNSSSSSDDNKAD